MLRAILERLEAYLAERQTVQTLKRISPKAKVLFTIFWKFGDGKEGK